MTRALGAAAGRTRGSIDELPSGALRVRVYAGVDPVTKRRHDLIEIIPPGPRADREARRVRDRLISQVEERRNPRTKATVDQLLERYLDQFDGAASTLTLYRGYVRNHISPFLGKIKVGALDADSLDAFYAELRRCRDHCSGRPFIQHRTTIEHDCDDRCAPHRCRPLGATTIRHMHFILSGSLAEGDVAPTEKQLAADHHVAVGTAHRAMELLKSWGFITSSRGRRAVIVRPPEPLDSPSADAPDNEAATASPQLWMITVRGPDGCRYPARHVCEDISRPDSFRAHLPAIARMERPTGTDRGESWIGDYELEIREPGKENEDPKFTLRWQPR